LTGITESLIAGTVRPQMPAPPSEGNVAQYVREIIGSIGEIASEMNFQNEKQRRQTIEALDSQYALQFAGTDWLKEVQHVSGQTDLQDFQTWKLAKLPPNTPQEVQTRFAARFFPEYLKAHQDALKSQAQIGVEDARTGAMQCVLTDMIDDPQTRTDLIGKIDTLEEHARDAGMPRTWMRVEFYQRAADALALETKTPAGMARAEWFAGYLRQKGYADLGDALVVNAQKNLQDVGKQAVTATSNGIVMSLHDGSAAQGAERANIAGQARAALRSVEGYMPPDDFHARLKMIDRYVSGEPFTVDDSAKLENERAILTLTAASTQQERAAAEDTINRNLTRVGPDETANYLKELDTRLDKAKTDLVYTAVDSALKMGLISESDESEYRHVAEATLRENDKIDPADFLVKMAMAGAAWQSRPQPEVPSFPTQRAEEIAGKILTGAVPGPDGEVIVIKKGKVKGTDLTEPEYVKNQLMQTVGVHWYRSPIIVNALKQKYPGIEIPTQTPAGKPLDRATANRILDEAGGDPQRAAQIAKDRGYSF
jgi:hypothetical protein